MKACVGRTLLSDAFDFSCIPEKIKSNSNNNCVGQECPTHTGWVYGCGGGSASALPSARGSDAPKFVPVAELCSTA